MGLIERYIKEVARHLPAALRRDVSIELESAIGDSVDAAMKDSLDGDRAIVIKAVLRDFGQPRTIALSYMPDNQFIIGPKYYRPFLRALKIVILAAYAVVLIGLIGYLVTEGPSLWEFYRKFVDSLGKFPVTAATLIGAVFAVFALLERFAVPKSSAGPEEETSWDPDTLPPLDDSSTVNRVATVLNLCLYSFLFILFNFFQERIGMVNLANGEYWFLPMLGDGFHKYLLWLNVWLVAAFILSWLLVREGIWRDLTRIYRITLDFLLAVILYLMAIDASIIGPPAGWTIPVRGLSGLDPVFRDEVIPMVGMGIRIALFVAAALTLITAGKRIWKMIRTV
ncbi:MAG: hypothetical protein KOO63_14265 [Bacteroidales bacterium]|nr:hypothetical protein [Candidatus Latescibacterota bacterium]